MPIGTSPSRPSSNAINLQRLFVLRNLAVLGQSVTIFVAVSVLGMTLPTVAMGAVIAALAVLNLLTRLRLTRPWPVRDAELFAQLLLDVAALTVVLFLSGGPTNPFVSLYLLPITLAAAALPARYTWSMAAITAVSYSLLMLDYRPMPHVHTDRGSEFDLHVTGMWLGFVISASLIAYFVVKMGQTLRDRDRDLAALREDQLRNERILALGTLATGAAHELGTPLSTMAVLLKDMPGEAGTQPQMEDKLAILRDQVQRCKQILSTLSESAGYARAEGGSGMMLDRYLEEIVAYWHGLRPAVEVRAQWQGVQPAPRILAEQTLGQAIVNILNNAADASPAGIEVEGRWDQRELHLEVRDRGPGVTPAVEERAGTAFFTTKAPGQGLGLGLFLAHATLRRFGGQVQLFNRAGGGACTRLTLPLTDLLVGS
jgi:two-component system sensor histidine kinase RegB